jgi:hypothetical protein
VRLLAVAGAAVAVALPVSAADLEPEVLVLRPTEVPRGYVIDRRESHKTPNEAFARSARVRKLVTRAGRVTGYVRVYRHHSSRLKVINAGVDLYRRPNGARRMLAFHDAEQRRHNERRGIIHAYGRERARIGSESWVYWSGYPGYFVLVVWRHGRLLGAVVTWDIGRQRTLALARLQQRRMAAVR